MRVGVRLKTLEVRLETVEIENRNGRLDLAEWPPDLCLVQLQCPGRPGPHVSDPGCLNDPKLLLSFGWSIVEPCRNQPGFRGPKRCVVQPGSSVDQVSGCEPGGRRPSPHTTRLINAYIDWRNAHRDNPKLRHLARRQLRHKTAPAVTANVA